jgi:hypothetical protein
MRQRDGRQLAFGLGGGDEFAPTARPTTSAVVTISDAAVRERTFPANLNMMFLLETASLAPAVRLALSCDSWMNSVPPGVPRPEKVNNLLMRPQ